MTPYDTLPGVEAELTLEAHVFNARNIHWEPLVEPWRLEVCHRVS